MNRRGFRPDEVLFSPTTACNLVCAHCDVKRSRHALSIETATKFLRQCASAGVKRVGFTGGEPFLRLDFLCALSRSAVSQGLLFNRIMTNGVWWRDENDLKVAFIKLYNAGYDGSICVSVDAFHKQDLRKAARFIVLAAEIWRRPDIASIAYTTGARDAATQQKLRKLETLVKQAKAGIFLKKLKIGISPVGEAAGLRNAWGGKWFEEDHCQGPGNVFSVMPDGNVAPCCGYANGRKELSIGNIRRDSVKDILRNARENRFVHMIFGKGLTTVRKRLEGFGIRFPGKTSSHCYFCHYVMTKVPRRLFAKSLAVLLLVMFVAFTYAWAKDITAGKDCRKIPATVVKKVKIPKWYHEGLFFDGKSLWLANGEKGCIWVVDPASGEVTSSIQPVGNFVEAIVKADDGTIYSTEWHEKKIYGVTIDSGKLVTHTSASFEPAHPAGLITVGDRIFVVTWTRGMGTKFHLVELDKDLKVIDRKMIRDMHEPDQLAWDGKCLWVSSWFSKLVYKIDIERWELAGYFCSPVGKTTGIAWDGKYIWVTGTYGDLYQMEIGT